MHILVAICSLSLVGTATVLDVRRHRVPNWLSYGGLALAFGLHGLFDGFEGLRHAMWGTAVGGGILLPLWLLGGAAAGDVKLMAAVGAYLGPTAAAFAVVATLIVGGVLGTAWMIRRKTADRGRKDLRTMPYAPAIALGTSLTFFLAWLQAA